MSNKHPTISSMHAMQWITESARLNKTIVISYKDNRFTVEVRRSDGITLYSYSTDLLSAAIVGVIKKSEGEDYLKSLIGLS